MPYSKNAELPEQVQEHLPKGAQTMYREAFNGAWQQYADRSDREATAHKVAWSAVKKAYEKKDGGWVKK